MQTIHFIITLSLNDSPSWCYNTPRVEAHINFSLPTELISPKLITDLLEKEIKNLKDKFPQAIAEYEEEQRANEARKAQENS